MKIINLSKHNIISLNKEIEICDSLGIAGLSGSGKTSFCNAIFDEYRRRMISLLPNSDKEFLFRDFCQTDFGTLNLKEIPPIKFFHQDGISLSSRSTIGTHTGLLKSLRRIFADKYDLSTQFFSYNNYFEGNEKIICAKCKGRGTYNGNECPCCFGQRYSNEIRNFYVKIEGKRYDFLKLFQMPIHVLLGLSDGLQFTNKDKKLLEVLDSMELGYLAMDRTFSTLSGGETTRIQLAETLVSSNNYLIIVDELSHGLDSYTLQNVVKMIAQDGQLNTFWFIDHSDEVLNATKEKLYFGPLSGSNGGKIVNCSPRPEPKLPNAPYVEASEYFDFYDLHCRNINIKSFKLPTQCIVGVCGKSGCGKSTLIRECILPQLKDKQKNITVLVVEQNKAKMVTRASTVATFLKITDLITSRAKVTKKKCNHCDGVGINEDGNVCKLCNGTGIDRNYFEALYSNEVSIYDLYNYTISDLLKLLDENNQLYGIFKELESLGIGHLSLSRTIRSLSSGEYQALYLVSCLTRLQKNQKYFLFLDEPTRGLSQNIVNEFAKTLRKLQSEFSVTIVFIEHSKFMLEAADYVVDFGNERSDNVTSLKCVQHTTWEKRIRKEAVKNPVIPSMHRAFTGIHYIEDQGRGNKEFLNAENQFLYTMRRFSDTAEWIYSSHAANIDLPIIALDFSRKPYSKFCRLWNVGNVISQLIIKFVKDKKEAEYFDFRNPYNHCLSCKGTGFINTIDFGKCFVDYDAAWDKGLLKDDVFSALRNYNFSRIKKMFNALKSFRGVDLSKKFSQMSSDEKNIIMYGDWNFKLPVKQNKSYVWRGLNFLIQKYMRESSSPLKQIIQDSITEKECPICHGRTLKHKEMLLYESKDIMYYLTLPLLDLIKIFPDIYILKDIMKIVGKESRLSEDISLKDKEVQCLCKLYDLYISSFSGFKIYIKNFPETIPNFAKEWLSEISRNNQVIVCNVQKQMKYKIEDLLQLMVMEGKRYTKSTRIYRIFGYTDIDKSIKEIKKKYKCSACDGKGKVLVVSDNNNINNLTEKCSKCEGSGINIEGLSIEVSGITVKEWFKGDIHTILPQEFAEGVYIPLLSKISELSEEQISMLVTALKGGYVDV